MAFKVGAVVGEAILKTAKWTSGAALIQKGAKKMGGALVTAAKVGFAALSAALVKSTFEANKFQKAFSNVTTLISDQDENFQDISKSLLKLDSRLGNTTELTEGLYQALSAGAEDAAAGLVIVEQAAKFSTAALTDNATAVDVLTTAMNAYGTDVISAAKASDLFFTTIKEGKINGEQLSSTIGQSIPLFASTGIALEELTSGMAAMTKQGVSASESTTQLNAIVNSFLKPSENLSASLQELGFESGAAFLETEGLAGALKLLEDQSGGDAAALAELLPNIRAMRGAMALTGKGGEEFSNILEEMGKATGATDKAFEKQEITFQTFQNELLKSQVIVGNISKFFVDKLAVGAQKALEAMNSFLLSSEGMETFAKVASIVGSAFGVIEEGGKVIFETIAPALSEAVDSIKEAFSGLVSEMEGGLTGMDIFATIMKTIGKILVVDIKLIKLGTIAIIDFVQIIMKGGEIISAFYQAMKGEGTWSDFKKAASEGGDAVVKMIKNIKDNGVEVGAAIKDVGTTIVDGLFKADDAVDETSKRISDNMKNRSEQAKTFFLKNWNELVTGVEDGSKTIVKTVEDAGNDVPPVVENMVEESISSLDKFKAWADDNLSSFADKFTFAFDTISEAASLAFGGISDISSQFYDNEFAKLENANNTETTALTEKHEAEQLALDTSLANNLITEAEHDTKQMALDTKQAKATEALRKDQLKKENDLKKKQFDNNKKLAAAQIWLDFATAAMGFVAAYAAIPFAGPIIAGSLTAGAFGIAVAQTALVNDQEFVPAMKEGGTGSGLTQLNEQGGELQILKDGTKIVPHDISRDIAASVGGGMGDTVNVNNPIVRNDSDIQKIAKAVDRILSRRASFA